MSGDDPFDLVGDVLDGQYRVDAFAGEGDLSVVYRGHHLGLDAAVTIKCLNLPTTLDEALVRPLIESFQEAGRLHYRLAQGSLHIAQALGAGQTVAPRTGTTLPYLVREWFDGESLASDLAHRRQKSEKGRTVDDAIALLEPAVEGIAYAHGQGIPHLSVNPSNLFLARKGGAQSLKVLDFGVARTMNELTSELPPDSRPPGGLRVLFPAYAAPEQLDRSVGEAGTWTDVYTLALVFMELVSDRIVMRGTETGAIVERALDPKQRPTPSLHGLRLARNLEIVLTRAVARAPDRRQKDAAGLWKDVKSALRGTASRSLPTVAPKATPPPVRVASHTLMGIAPMSAGQAVPGRLRETAPSGVGTMPQSFEPPPAAALSAPPPSPPSLRPGPSLRLAAPTPPAAAPPSPAPPAPAPAQTITAKLPPPPPPDPFRALAPFAPIPPHPVLPALAWPGAARQPLPRATVLALLAGSGLLALALLVTLVVLLVGSLRKGAAAAPAASLGPSATNPSPPPSSPIPPSSAAAPMPTTTTPFSSYAAKRALDGVSRDVAKCKRGVKWGVASATVTFANDGSVAHVLLGPPFRGTQTGQCVADVMSTARVPPFAGQGIFIAQFYVAPQ